jgi:hypothetical protein
MTELEYYKTILEKVRFDDSLLKKEIEKAVRTIKCEQQPELLDWIKKELDQHYVTFADSLMKAKNCSFGNNS